MGHIVCIDCKKRYLGISHPCPVCRSPLPRGDSTSYIVGSLISILSDIPCSFKDSGCNFEGRFEDLKTHGYACKFGMVECVWCHEECMRKDFLSHNNKNCFLTSPNNTFKFPSRNNHEEYIFYLVQVNT